MVSTLDSGLSVLSLSPGQGQCCVLEQETLLSGPPQTRDLVVDNSL